MQDYIVALFVQITRPSEVRIPDLAFLGDTTQVGIILEELRTSWLRMGNKKLYGANATKHNTLGSLLYVSDNFVSNAITYANRSTEYLQLIFSSTASFNHFQLVPDACLWDLRRMKIKWVESDGTLAKSFGEHTPCELGWIWDYQ